MLHLDWICPHLLLQSKEQKKKKNKKKKKKKNIHEVRLVFTSLFLRMSVELIELDEKRMK